MKRAAHLAFPDEHGEPQCRLVLEREASPGATAAWLMCNPSRASDLIDDPTAGRVVGHSARFGCSRALVGNICPLRTPYPADLWRMIRAGVLTEAMQAANLDALAMLSAQATVRVVAFGAEYGRRYPAAVEAALRAFTLGGTVEVHCLGTTADGWPLHPLARGKAAIPRDVALRPWSLGPL